MLLLGVTKKYDIEVNEIWSPTSDHFYHWATITMSGDRFQEITSLITFDDIDMREFDKKNKFHLMHEVFYYIRNKIKAALDPGSELCIDETLWPFKGNCSFRQSMKSKPAKCGIKYWILACVLSGYLCDFDVYLGNSEHETEVGKIVNNNFNTTPPYLKKAHYNSYEKVFVKFKNY